MDRAYKNVIESWQPENIYFPQNCNENIQK